MNDNVLIKGGRVVDPASGLDSIMDVFIENGVISKVSGGIENPPDNCSVIDSAGLLVIPGLVDMHTHLREPGFEYKETIATGTRAAVRGGFTAVCCMANTNPVNDEPAITRFILSKAASDGACPVYPIGAITVGLDGKNLAEMASLADAGCVAFSDDGKPVMDSLLMRRALEYSRIFGKPVISHSEDARLVAGGVMNEGLNATRMGLRGIPWAAEEVMIARDIALCELSGGRLHVAHISTKGSVRLIREAKARGLAVTAETCPHYFTITDEACIGYNTAAKVNPPLRARADKLAIREGLADGTIDAIATDHAPHHREEKAMGFDDAPFGISGLETALALSLRMVEKGVISLNRMIDLMSAAPCRIMGIPERRIAEGSVANITIVDPAVEWEVDPASFVSLGKNTPFEGLRLKGRAAFTIVNGRVCENFKGD
ncbi:MAG: dihydroorotase [Nitrospirae bacterium]|nr:dihydroorotase [Nitrospirota bacterium]